MTTTKTVGLGLGAVVAGAVASCPLVQASLLGMLGALGALPFVQRHRILLVLAIVVFSALTTYATVRMWRARRTKGVRAPIVNELAAETRLE